MLRALPFGALILAASPAAAQGMSQWHLTGEISGESFVVDCRFEPQAHQLGGVCIDTASSYAANKAGKPHVLTRGASDGNRLSWSYDAKVMFFSVGIDFTGVITGDRMTGTITAAGRKGGFTAVRK